VAPLRLRIRHDHAFAAILNRIPAGIGLASVVAAAIYSGWIGGFVMLGLFLAVLLPGSGLVPGSRGVPIHRMQWDWLGIDPQGEAWVATVAGLEREQRYRICVCPDSRVFLHGVVLIFFLPDQRRQQVLWLSARTVGPDGLRRLRVWLRWPMDRPEKSSWRTRLIRVTSAAAGILNPGQKSREGKMPTADTMPKVDHLLSSDPDHVYSEEELDAIEAVDPELALRLDRAQTFALRAQAEEPADGPIDEEAVRGAVEEARRILSQDGGDLEYLGLEGRVVRVRLKGACVGCPRSTLDLKNVVERLVKARAPGVQAVSNQF
jgi:toxin CptA